LGGARDSVARRKAQALEKMSLTQPAAISSLKSEMSSGKWQLPGRWIVRCGKMHLFACQSFANVTTTIVRRFNGRLEMATLRHSAAHGKPNRPAVFDRITQPPARIFLVEDFRRRRP
jgi:hypothetical protein